MTFRVLHVISSAKAEGGGPIEGVCQLARRLKTLDYSVEVVCTDTEIPEAFADSGVVFHALGPSTLGNYKYCLNLRTWLEKNVSRFDAVIVNGLWQYHGFATWRVLRKANIPYFVFTHGMLDPWFKRTYPLKHLKKWLYWPWAEYRVLRDAKAVLFTCEEERRLAKESFWLYRCNEVVTSYGTTAPPTDDSGHLRERFFQQHPNLRNKRLFLFLSRIHEKKGCDLLIQAFSQIMGLDPLLHLVMAGPDQTGWATALKQQALSLGVTDRVTWTGMLLGDDKWAAFHACEAFCLPSHQENFGIVVAEALGCGKAVLISDKVNIWREIEQDVAGIVNEDTLVGTVAGLTAWLNMKDTQRAAMKERARVCFDSRFRIERVADSLINIVSGNTESAADSAAIFLRNQG